MSHIFRRIKALQRRQSRNSLQKRLRKLPACIDCLESRTLLSAASTPDIPTGLTATGESTTSILLTWNSVASPVSGYNIHERHVLHSPKGSLSTITYPTVVSGITSTSVLITVPTAFAGSLGHTYYVTSVSDTSVESGRSAPAVGLPEYAPSLYDALWNGAVVSSVPVKAGDSVQIFLLGYGNPAPTYSLVSGPTGLSVDSISGTVTYSPAIDDMGIKTATFEVTNPVSSATAQFQFNVLGSPTVTGSNGDDALYIKVDSSGSNIDIWENAPTTDAPTAEYSIYNTNALDLFGIAGQDQITLDFSNGSPIPSGGINYDGGNGVGHFTVVGKTNNVGGTINVVGGTANFDNDANGLSISVRKNAVASFSATQHLAALTITDGGLAQITPGNTDVLVINNLSIGPAGVLDLTDGGMIIPSDFLNREAVMRQVSTWIQTGRNGGTWDGKGIISSLAAADPNHITGLASAVNDINYTKLVTTSLNGEPAGDFAILVKYTFNGDTDFNGKIDADDYFQIDSEFETGGNGNLYNEGFADGYRIGDFDYNGIIDSDDYFLIDRSFLVQGNTAPAATLVKPAAQAKVTKLTHHKSHK